MIEKIILKSGKMLSIEEAEELYQDLARLLGKVPAPDKTFHPRHDDGLMPEWAGWKVTCSPLKYL